VLEEFKELRSSYVVVLIRAFNEVAAEGKDIDWKPLLGLCAWVGVDLRHIQRLLGHSSIISMLWKSSEPW
jgi:hypothetical protein